MLKKALLTITAMTSLLPVAHAGTITILSLDVDQPSTMYNIPPAYTFTAQKASSNKFGMVWTLYGGAPNVPSPFDDEGRGNATIEGHLRVKWTPSYLGEPKPLGVPCTWNVKHANQAQFYPMVNLFSPANYCRVTIGSIPGVSGFPLDTTLSSPGTTSAGHALTTSTGVVHGEVSFHEENGEWIGVGTIAIVNDFWFHVHAGYSESGFVNMSGSMEMILTAVGGHLVAP